MTLQPQETKTPVGKAGSRQTSKEAVVKCKARMGDEEELLGEQWREARFRRHLWTTRTCRWGDTGYREREESGMTYLV